MGKCKEITMISVFHKSTGYDVQMGRLNYETGKTKYTTYYQISHDSVQRVRNLIDGRRLEVDMHKKFILLYAYF